MTQQDTEIQIRLDTTSGIQIGWMKMPDNHKMDFSKYVYRVYPVSTQFKKEPKMATTKEVFSEIAAATLNNKEIEYYNPQRGWQTVLEKDKYSLNFDAYTYRVKQEYSTFQTIAAQSGIKWCGELKEYSTEIVDLCLAIVERSRKHTSISRDVMCNDISEVIKKAFK